MNSMTVCLTVGAISFVRCEFNAGPPLRHQGYTYSEERTSPPNPSTAPGPSDSSFFSSKEPIHTNQLLKDFHHLKYIYDECKNKVTKRTRKFKKINVNWNLPELKSYFWSLYQCIKVYGFRALDVVLQDDFIPVTDYAYFVRDGLNGTEEFSSPRAAGDGASTSLKDYAARVLTRHWTALLRDRIDSFLQTHSLKLRLQKTLITQGRSRRRDHRMFAMMVMGFMIMASILIPMGFQFLTVLGGKSLLLAKMALIMSAINGLKKIATSNVGYGFYHTPTDGHHHEHLHHGFHEKHFHLNPNNYNQLQQYN